IDFAAPVRFIYETFIRPFPNDPTPIVEMKWTGGSLSIQNGNQFVRTEGKWGPAAAPLLDGDGFQVGHKITVSGFSNESNNGTFIVTGVTDTVLTVDAVLIDEVADGNEKIVVKVPKTGVTTLGVDAGTNSFTRTSGSFLADGFIAGQRF